MSPPLPTASQTVGPFYGLLFLRREPLNTLVGPEIEGQRIRIEGRVIDGDGVPIGDAMVEIWQANAHGRYNHPGDTRDLPLDSSFTGFGRSGTEDGGRFWFETIKPGPVPFDGQRDQAPHIVVTVFARGMLNHVATRLYFEDEPANETDPILQLVPAERRKTLLAEREPLPDKDLYRFDIVLQGQQETVFFRR